MTDRLVCEHHERADCLELTDGEIDASEGRLTYVELHYRCEHFPALEGVYRAAGDVETTHGAVVAVDEPVRAGGER